MRIENRSVTIERPPPGGWLPAVAAGLARLDAFPLRFAVVAADDRTARVEATLVRCDASEPYADRLRDSEILHPRRRRPAVAPFAVVQIVPTGIRCAFGGYAGDAGPATNLLAAAADLVVTHPNAVNASELNEMAANVLYVEGRSLDDFLLGHLALQPVSQNVIGTFVDRTGAARLDVILDVLNAARSVRGIDCGTYTLLDRSADVQVAWSDAGCAVGTIGDPASVLDGVARLVERGCTAIGGVSVIGGVSSEAFAGYQAGVLPNPSGGVEAILSHLVSRVFRVPTAHAPLPYYQRSERAPASDPRAAAEFISTPHYFSVLKGLHAAPRLVPLASLDAVPAQAVSLGNVGAVVVPATALGGLPALAAELNDIPLIAVADNTTVLAIDNTRMRMANVVPVRSYTEAAGVILALRSGIALESVRRPLLPPRRV